MITLHLKKKFFDQIVRGEKKVEYRADNSYYRKLFDCFYKDNFSVNSGNKKDWVKIKICLGYPKKDDPEKNKFVWVSHVSFTNYLEMNYKDIGECYYLKKFDTEIKNCYYRLELELKK